MLEIILIGVLLGNIGSLLLASLMLKINPQRLQKLIRNINAFAGGALLGAAFIGMLPTAIKISSYKISYVVLIGILFFFVLEKIIIWRICVDANCDRHNKTGALMLMAGDSFHNFLDGVVISAAFLQSASFGFVVTLSVFAHEVPQEIADFGVMIKAGYSKQKAIAYNLISGLAAVIGATLSWFTSQYVQIALPYILAFSAAGFIYIALADLIPELHRKSDLKQSVIQFILLTLGIIIIIISAVTKPNLN